MDKIYLLITFIFGVVFSSFLCVVGFRLPQKISFIKGKSQCDSCKHKLHTLDLIPIFSYIFLKGKCRYCKKNIPSIIPICELIGGLLFSFSYYQFGFSWNFIIGLLISSLFIIVIVTDVMYYIIPDEVIITFSLLLIIVQFFNTGLKGLGIHLLSGIILFLVMYLTMILGEKIFKKESLGGADVKIMFIIGLVLEPMIGLITIFLGSIIALPISLIVLVKNKTNMIPFGPFLLLATIILYYSKINIEQLIQLLT